MTYRLLLTTTLTAATALASAHAATFTADECGRLTAEYDNGFPRIIYTRSWAGAEKMVQNNGSSELRAAIEIGNIIQAQTANLQLLVAGGCALPTRPISNEPDFIAQLECQNYFAEQMLALRTKVKKEQGPIPAKCKETPFKPGGK